MTDRITTRAQLAAMAPDDIEEARVTGRIDMEALDREHNAATAAEAEHVADIRRRIKAGADPLTILHDQRASA